MTLESGLSRTLQIGDGPTEPSQRLPVLDILRGMALFGMVIVHVDDYGRATGGGAIGAGIQQAIEWFVTEKAYTTFAILFGVGCAIQLRQPNVRDNEIRWRYLRRLFGLWTLIMVFIALTGRGGTVIVYVYSAVWLLFIRRWPMRALIPAVIVSAMLGGLWNVAIGGYQWATMGVVDANRVYQSGPAPSPARQAADHDIDAAYLGTSYSKFVAANVKLSQFVQGPLHADFLGDWHRPNPGLLLASLLSPALTFFIIGLLAFRHGVFHRPAAHRQLLMAVVIGGIALWAVDQWRLHDILWSRTSALSVIPVGRVARPIQSWFVFGRTPGWFLALTYIAGILLVVGSSRKWERRLASVFASAGRLAFTNYVLHFAVLTTLYLNWGFGLRGKFTPQTGAVTAVILFATLVMFSRWWLARFRLGPVEWLLRSVTYGRLQTLRRAEIQA